MAGLPLERAVRKEVRIRIRREREVMQKYIMRGVYEGIDDGRSYDILYLVKFWIYQVPHPRLLKKVRAYRMG